MATKKAQGEPKTKDAPAAKAGGKTATAKEKPKTNKVSKAPAKLSSAQSDLLGRIGAADAAGYLSTKKNEQRTLEALAERKLVKRGAKDKASGQYRYLVSTAGRKHLGAQPAAAAPAAAPPATPAPAAP